MIFRIFGFKVWTQHFYSIVFDVFTAYYMKPCEVFIGQSPMHVYCLKYAKRKYNAITILERGTSHVLDFIDNIKDNPALKNKPLFKKVHILRDLSGYKFADYISVGSNHVLKSFIENGVSEKKIFVNNYFIFCILVC